jgi:Fe-S-cluster containining protein
MELSEFKFFECNCSKCVAMCRHSPCWPTPSEAKKLIQAGYAKDLEEDEWVDGEYYGSVFVLRPKDVFDPKGGPFSHACIFLKDDLCSIHNLKPFEGRAAIHSGDLDKQPSCRDQIAREWDKKLGKAVLKKWRELRSKYRNSKLELVLDSKTSGCQPMPTY